MTAPPPTDPGIRPWPLPYAARLESRDPAHVDLVVIHCTELPDLPLAREYGERVLYDTGTGRVDFIDDALDHQPSAAARAPERTPG